VGVDVIVDGDGDGDVAVIGQPQESSASPRQGIQYRDWGVPGCDSSRLGAHGHVAVAVCVHVQ
jgi:hypothetical protein